MKDVSFNFFFTFSYFLFFVSGVNWGNVSKIGSTNYKSNKAFIHNIINNIIYKQKNANKKQRPCFE